MLATPIYSATTQLLLDTRREKVVGVDQVLSDAIFDQTMVENQVTILQSNSLMRRVVEKENLVEDSEFGARDAPDTMTLSNLYGSVLSQFFPSAAGQTPSVPELQPEQRVSASIEALKAATLIDRLPRSFVITVSVRSRDRLKAARLSNALADAFIVDKLDARFEAAQKASAWLSDRLGELRIQLRDSEEAVNRFRVENGLIRAANMTLNEQQLSEMNAKLVSARTDTAEKKAKYDQLEVLVEAGGIEKAQSLPDVLKSTVISSLRGQEADVSRREADLIARYGERHPLVVNVRAERADIRNAIASETQRIASNLKNEFEVAKARETALEKSLREVTGQTGSDDKIAIRLRELERTASVNKMLFEDFLSRAKLTQEQSTFEARESRVINPATPPLKAAYPQKTLILFVAATLGILLGTVGAMAIESLNVGFTTHSQVEALLQLPVLSSINRMNAGELTVNGEKLPLHEFIVVKPLSRLSEAVRSLRTGVRMSDVDHPPKVIQMTSAIPNEGKTTLALSLAASTAAGGARVVLIDGDLRNPSTSRAIGASKEVGLVDILVGNASPEQVIISNGKNRPDIIAAGTRTQNPPDLLGSERMRVLIDWLREHYDLVVIDTPPVGPVVDAVIVSDLVDKIVFVVRWSETARQMVSQCINRLSAKRRVAGIVFNLVDEQKAEKYGKYAYSYYYRNRYYKNYYVE